ncbi:MAG: matrixin family metalloprotease [Parcubacteria group bacterium]
MKLRSTIRKYISVIVLVLVGVVFLVYADSQDICKKPLEYRIGELDERFDASKEELLEAISKAELLWESLFDNEFFVYNPEADFVINFIFDERQGRTIEAIESRESIDLKEEKYGRLIERYDNFLDEYKKLLSSYNNAVNKYKEDLKKYNEEVELWNSQGDVPPKMIKELEERKVELGERSKEFELQRAELNKLSQDINLVSSDINDLVQNIDEAVNEYNKRFGALEEFDQGDYNGEAINVYQFENEQELVLLLAHEFGHALEIEHLDNPEAIMHYIMGGQDYESPELTQEDIQALKIKCTNL